MELHSVELHSMELHSKQSQVINNLFSFFWWNINFFCFFWFFLFFSFTYWSNFISYFISYQIIKSSVASAVFWTTLLDAIFAASMPVFVAVSINFLPYLLPNLLANDKKPQPLTYFLNLGSVEYLIFIRCLQLMNIQ